MKDDERYELLSGDIVCCTYIDGELSIINRELAPLYLDDFREWAASRAISSSRGLTARNLKVASGLSANEKSFETAMKVHAACITDNFWVRQMGSELTYKDVCFDEYSGYFQDLALGKDYTYIDYKSDMSNPELTNIGGSDKAWVIDDKGTRWLYKRQPLRECYNEIFASRLAAALGIDTVHYELAEYTEPNPEIGRYGIVRSKDFTQGRNINFEPAKCIINHFRLTDSDTEKIADIFRSMGLEQAYLDIKYLDILTGNPDRHSQNYGILRDRDTGKVVGMAPNFDNNFAFLARDMETEGFLKAVYKYGWKRSRLSEELISSVLDQIQSIKGFEGYVDERIISTILKNDDFDGVR